MNDIKDYIKRNLILDEFDRENDQDFYKNLQERLSKSQLSNSNIDQLILENYESDCCCETSCERIEKIKSILIEFKS